MLELNLSKGDLKKLCCAFGVSTDSVKVDLVQKLKQLLSEVGQNPNSVKETGETSLRNCDADDQGYHVIEMDDFNIDSIAEPNNSYANTEEYQHEYDSLHTIGTELDLAKESRSSSEVMIHIEKACE
ncbi:15069_t:CDS:2, partial [Dentiscutata heterogama]